ncbi:hypothetical protein TNCV_4456951 [Trichonephila clavipes]|nr:hypothetical protein TNCV_4456951 [Trichonephila clavipes]
MYPMKKNFDSTDFTSSQKRDKINEKGKKNMLGGVLEHDAKMVDSRPWTPPLKNFCVSYRDDHTKRRLTRKDFPSGNELNNIWKTRRASSSSEEFAAVDGDNVCTAPQLW